MAALPTSHCKGLKRLCRLVIKQPHMLQCMQIRCALIRDRDYLLQALTYVHSIINGTLISRPMESHKSYIVTISLRFWPFIQW